MGQLWQSELLFLADMLKNTGLQGSTYSGHGMTTGFSPFEVPAVLSELVARCVTCVMFCVYRASIEKYLLEKSRIISQAPGER